MSIDKSKIKQAAYHDVGCDADEMRESALKEIAKYGGGKAALQKAVKDLTAIASRIDDDLDEGKFDEMEPLQVAEYAKLSVQRCVDSLTNAAGHWQNNELTALGAFTAFEKVVKTIKKKHDLESARIDELGAAIEAGDVEEGEDGELEASEESPPHRRPTGVRPAPSLAERRKAEDAEAVPEEVEEEDAADAG